WRDWNPGVRRPESEWGREQHLPVRWQGRGRGRRKHCVRRRIGRGVGSGVRGDVAGVAQNLPTIGVSGVMAPDWSDTMSAFGGLLKFVVGGAAGTAVGLAVGSLLAPKKGSDFQADVQSRIAESK